MKRASVVLVLLMAAVSIAATYNGYTSPTILVDGEAFVADVPPIIVDGRTLAPVRALAERLGYSVGWDEPLQVVTLESPIEDATLEERVFMLEERIKKLEGEIEGLKIKLTGTAPSITPDNPIDLPLAKYGEKYSIAGFDLIVGEPQIVKDEPVPGLPYSMSIAFTVNAQLTTSIDCNALIVRFNLADDVAEEALNKASYSRGTPVSSIAAGGTLTWTMRWYLDKAAIGLRGITIYWPDRQTPLVNITP